MQWSGMSEVGCSVRTPILFFFFLSVGREGMVQNFRQAVHLIFSCLLCCFRGHYSLPFFEVFPGSFFFVMPSRAFLYNLSPLSFSHCSVFPKAPRTLPNLLQSPPVLFSPLNCLPHRNPEKALPPLLPLHCTSFLHSSPSQRNLLLC